MDDKNEILRKKRKKEIVFLCIGMLILALSGLFVSLVDSWHHSGFERRIKSLENVQMDILKYLQSKKK